MVSFVRLTEVSSRVVAQPLVDFLADQGIEARIESDDCGGTNPLLATILGTFIRVPENDYNEAKALLEEWENAEPQMEE